MTANEFLDNRKNRIGLAIILIGGLIWFYSRYGVGFESSEKNTKPPATN